MASALLSLLHEGSSEQGRPPAQPHDAYMVVIGSHGDGFESLFAPAPGEKQKDSLSLLPVDYRAVELPSGDQGGAAGSFEDQAIGASSSPRTLHVWHVKAPSKQEQGDEEKDGSSFVAARVHEVMRVQGLLEDPFKALQQLAQAQKGGGAAATPKEDDARELEAGLARLSVVVALDASRPWDLFQQLQSHTAFAEAVAAALQAPLSSHARERLRLLQRLRFQVGGAPGLLAPSQADLLKRCLMNAQRQQEEDEAANASADGVATAANQAPTATPSKASSSSNGPAASTATAAPLSSEGIEKAAEAALESFVQQLPALPELCNLLPSTRPHELENSIGFPTFVLLLKSEHLLPASSSSVVVSSSASSAAASSSSSTGTGGGAEDGNNGPSAGSILLKAIAGDPSESVLLRQLVSQDKDVRAALSSLLGAAGGGGVMSLQEAAAKNRAEDAANAGVLPGSTEAMLARLDAVRGGSGSASATEEEEDDKADGDDGQETSDPAILEARKHRRATRALLREFLSTPTPSLFSSSAKDAVASEALAKHFASHAATGETAFALAWLALQKLYLPHKAFEASFVLAFLRLQALRLGASFVSLPSPSSGLIMAAASGATDIRSRFWQFAATQLLASGGADRSLLLKACLPPLAPSSPSLGDDDAPSAVAANSDVGREEEQDKASSLGERIRAAMLHRLLTLAFGSQASTASDAGDNSVAEALAPAPESSSVWRMFLPSGADSLSLLVDVLRSDYDGSSGAFEEHLLSLLSGSSSPAASSSSDDASALVAAAASDRLVFKRISGDPRPLPSSSGSASSTPAHFSANSSLMDAIMRPGGDERTQKALRELFLEDSTKASLSARDQARVEAEGAAAIIVSRLVEEPFYPSMGKFLAELYDLQQAAAAAAPAGSPAPVSASASGSTPRASPPASSSPLAPLGVAKAASAAASPLGATSADALLSHLDSLSISGGSSGGTATATATVSGAGAASATAGGSNLSVRTGGSGAPVAGEGAAGVVGTPAGGASTPGSAASGAAGGGDGKPKDPKSFFQSLINKKK